MNHRKNPFAHVPRRLREYGLIEGVDYLIDGEHWIWIRANNRRYGVVRIRDTTTTAQRVAYYLAYRKLSPSAEIHHLCGETLCVNPAHLIECDWATHRSVYHRSRVEDIERTQMLAILLWGIPQCAVAEAYGIPDSYLSRIKRNLVRSLSWGPFPSDDELEQYLAD